MAKKCLSHKLALFFGILLVTLTVHLNTQVVAVRDLPLEIEVIEEILLPHLTREYKGCGKACKSSADCDRKAGVCTQCRVWSKKARDKTNTRCYSWI
ncbi:hypothetical protein RND71_027111 [Anisodus tanguticus]|uniref:Carboxypeptidase A inhibitor-like domain-containing protein n=1 Tax=Anisodus tanguticus TaxID=243964 RepID=A0AAE1RQ31_9SOLA|nr:hypothetical protein RND71_027111 [Anisodus tanguticus]